MSTPSLGIPSRLGASLLLAAAVPLLLAGCEAEAVELAQEIRAARGDCTTEALRRSDEECVRMMERYTEMGTDLVHTYIGGLKALDMALDRMPPVEFDTAGLGYAISPEFRAGDPFGEGASPRLAPTAAAYSYAPLRQSAAIDRFSPRPGVTRPDPRGRSEVGGGARPLGPRADRGSGVPRRSREDWDRDRRFYDRGPYDAFGYGGRDWWGYGDAYRYLESGPEGYFNSGPYAYFYQRPYGSLGAYGYRGYGYPYAFDPRNDGYGYGSYGYDGYGFDGYGYDVYYDGYRDAYAPRAGYDQGYYGGFGDAYDPRAVHGYRYDDYAPYGYHHGDPYAPGAGYGDPYRGGGGYGARPPVPGGPYARDGYGAAWPDRPLPRGERSAADEWGYDPGDPAVGDDVQRPPPADVSPAGPAAAPDRPAPQRPGILLPPEERLRRPWLDD